MQGHEGTGGVTEGLTESNEPPPILGSWSNLYTVVLVWLAILIFVFYLFTQYFS